MFYRTRGSWQPSDELQRILDVVRESYRRLFLNSWMAEMSIEEAIAEYKKEGMYCTNLYERRDGGWNCFLRYEKNGLLAESGFGADAQEAIFDALRKAKKNGFENRDLPEPDKRTVGFAGEKSPAQLAAYGTPMVSQMPNNLGDKSDREHGIVPTEHELPETDVEFEDLEAPKELDVAGILGDLF